METFAPDPRDPPSPVACGPNAVATGPSNPGFGPSALVIVARMVLFPSITTVWPIVAVIVPSIIYTGMEVGVPLIVVETQDVVMDGADKTVK